MGDTRRDNNETNVVSKYVANYDKVHKEVIVNLPIRDCVILNRKVEGYMYVMYPLTKRECFTISNQVKEDRNLNKFSIIEKFNDTEGYTTKQVVCLGSVNLSNKDEYDFIHKLLQTGKDIYIPKSYNFEDHTGIVNKDSLIQDYKLYWRYLYNCIGNPDKFIIIKKKVGFNENYVQTRF